MGVQLSGVILASVAREDNWRRTDAAQLLVVGTYPGALTHSLQSGIRQRLAEMVG